MRFYCICPLLGYCLQGDVWACVGYCFEAGLINNVGKHSFFVQTADVKMVEWVLSVSGNWRLRLYCNCNSYCNMGLLWLYPFLHLILHCASRGAENSIGRMAGLKMRGAVTCPRMSILRHCFFFQNWSLLFKSGPSDIVQSSYNHRLFLGCEINLQNFATFQKGSQALSVCFSFFLEISSIFLYAVSAVLCSQREFFGKTLSG